MMKSWRPFCFILLGLWLGTAGWAQLPGQGSLRPGDPLGQPGPPSRPLSLEEAIRIGLEKSRTLHASWLATQAAEARVGEVHAARLPTLKFTGSYAYLSEVPPFQVTLPVPLPPPAPSRFTISPFISHSYTTRLTLQQPLFTGFRLQHSSRLAEYTARASQQDYRTDRGELIYDIQRAYWGLFKAIALKKMADENVERVNAHLKDVENFFAQGMATHDEVLRVQVQLSSAKLLQINSDHEVQLARLGLNSLIGLPLDTEVVLESPPEPEPRDVGELRGLVESALERRPEVKALGYRLKAAEAGLRVAQSGWLPQVYLVGNYYYARPNPRILPARDRFDDTWDIGVSVSWDLWNWGTPGHQADQAEAQLAQARDALAQLKDGITVEVTQNYLNLIRAKERIAVAKQGVQQAEESHRIINEKYRVGLALNSDLLDAEVALLRAQTDYTQALVDYQLAEAALQKAIGEP